MEIANPLLATLEAVDADLATFSDGDGSRGGQYDQLYQETMERIEDQNSAERDLARRTLSWVCFSIRPLAASEVRIALAISSGDRALDRAKIPGVDAVLSSCLGLVRLVRCGQHVASMSSAAGKREKEDGIRLIHPTAQEYLIRTRTRWLPECSSYLAVTCATCVAFDAYASGAAGSLSQLRKRYDDNVFYEYAACSWLVHARDASTPYADLARALEHTGKLEAAWEAFFSRWPRYRRQLQKYPRKMTRLHAATFFGAQHLVPELVRLGDDPDGQNSHGITPLGYAVGLGHEYSAEILLRTGKVNLEWRDPESGHSLAQKAACSGAVATFRLLAELELSSGKMDHLRADLDGIGDEPLLCLAARNGQAEFVKMMILEHDEAPQAQGRAKSDIRDPRGRSPLSLAAEGGYLDVVRLLVTLGKADPASRDHLGRTPLCWAASRGREDVVKFLIESCGCDAHSKDSRGREPLSHAAENGQVDMVRYLLKTCTGDFDGDGGKLTTMLAAAPAPAAPAVGAGVGAGVGIRNSELVSLLIEWRESHGLR